jgi:hypothetical protein
MRSFLTVQNGRIRNQTIEVIAAREHKSERSIRMTLPLAFVAPRSSPRQLKAACRAGSEPSD